MVLKHYLFAPPAKTTKTELHHSTSKHDEISQTDAHQTSTQTKAPRALSYPSNTPQSRLSHDEKRDVSSQSARPTVPEIATNQSTTRYTESTGSWLTTHTAVAPRQPGQGCNATAVNIAFGFLEFNLVSLSSSKS